MSIEKIQQATNLLRLGLNEHRGKLSGLHDAAFDDVENCRDNILYLADALRQNYDTLMRPEDYRPQERFFLFKDGEIQEVEEHEYMEHMQVQEDASEEEN